MGALNNDGMMFNLLVVDVLRLVTTDWEKPNTAALSSKNYRVEVEYGGKEDGKLFVNIYKKASGYVGAGQIKPGLIFMGGARLDKLSEHITNTGHFTLDEMTVALREVYDREAGMVLPGKKIYSLLEPFIERDDKSVIFSCGGRFGPERTLTVMHTSSRVELHVGKEEKGIIEFDYLIGFRTNDPNTAIRSKFGSLDYLPGILTEYLALVEDRKFNVSRRVKKNGRTVRVHR